MENAKYSTLSFPPPFDRRDAPFWGESEVQTLDQSLGMDLIGESAAIQRLRLQLKRVGPYFRSALLVGEPGTGKRRVAAALHELAAVDQGKLVTCDVQTLEAAAREGDAGNGRFGGELDRLIDAATNGSLLFDRIAEASSPAQSLLFRLLEQWDRDRREGRGRRGEIRILASSHEDLKVLASAGTFRQDLYQRLAMLQIRIPSLRERVEDIAPLARHFVRTFAEVYRRPARELSERAMERLLRHAWPGNVRELEMVIRSAVFESDGAVVDEQHLPVLSQADRTSAAEKLTSKLVRLQDVIDEHVLKTLRQCAGNKLRAAEMLGISRSTLYRMLDAASVAGRCEGI